MILLSGRVPTRVPESLRVTTAVPDPRVTTAVPTGPRVATAVPNPHLPTRVPSAPHIPTRRPPTKERLVARGSATVTGVARLHVRMAVEYAEQGIAITQATNVGVAQKVRGTCDVSGTADVWTRYAVDATQAVSVVGQGTPRDRRTLDAFQGAAVYGDGGAPHVTHMLDATQTVDTDTTVDFRPIVPLAATGDVTTDGAGMLGLAGSVVVYATQSIDTTSTATARLRYSIAAGNSADTTQTTTRDGITIPTVAAQAIDTAGQATTRPRHTVTALGSGVAAGTSVAGVKVAALGSATTTGSASPRGRYTVSGSGSAATTGAADVLARTFSRQRMNKVGNFTPPQNVTATVTGWSSDATAPATITNKQLVVQGSAPSATITVNIVAGSGGSNVPLRVMHGATLLETVQVSTTSIVKTYTRAVTAGDTLYIQTAAGFGSYRSINKGTYIDVNA